MVASNNFAPSAQPHKKMRHARAGHRHFSSPPTDISVETVRPSSASSGPHIFAHFLAGIFIFFRRRCLLLSSRVPSSFIGTSLGEAHLIWRVYKQLQSIKYLKYSQHEPRQSGHAHRVRGAVEVVLPPFPRHRRKFLLRVFIMCVALRQVCSFISVYDICPFTYFESYLIPFFRRRLMIFICPCCHAACHASESAIRPTASSSPARPSLPSTASTAASATSTCSSCRASAATVPSDWPTGTTRRVG